MTRPQAWGKALSLDEAMADAALSMQRFTVLDDGPTVWDHRVQLSSKYSFAGKQVHDANIVATMVAHGERWLLTFNDADFQRFAGLIEVVVP